MELFHVSLFSDRCPEIQEGWNFFKGSLEIKNPDNSTSLFGHIKNSFGKDFITLHNGYLNNNHPYFLKNDLRQSETSDYYLLTISSDGFIDISKSFRKKQGYVRIGPKRKKDKSMVLLTLCIKKDQHFKLSFTNPENGKTRDILISFSSRLNNFYVEDVTPVIIKSTVTIRVLRFLKKMFYKRPSVFGGL
jgi:hypothetical protein